MLFVRSVSCCCCCCCYMVILVTPPPSPLVHVQPVLPRSSVRLFRVFSQQQETREGWRTCAVGIREGYWTLLPETYRSESPVLHEFVTVSLLLANLYVRAVLRWGMGGEGVGRGWNSFEILHSSDFAAVMTVNSHLIAIPLVFLKVVLL